MSVRATANSFLILLLSTCFTHPSVQAAEPVQILGLPVGGKVPSWKVCPSDPYKSQAVCWIGKPFVHKGTRLGGVHVPNPDSRPRWAAHVVFNATVSAQGTLQVLKVSTVVPADRSEIANSIRARWGLPTATTLHQLGIGSAMWSKEDVTIDMLCQEKCSVEFRSAAAQAERDSQKAERSKQDAGRPVSP